MILVISPAKSLDFETPATTVLFSLPQFLEEAEIVNQKLRSLSAKKLAKLMDISPKLAELNFERNQLWSHQNPENPLKPAVLAFTGDVYQGMQADRFSEKQLEIAQKKIRILSGLYGLLRPLDLIQAYRLEMGATIAIQRKKDLYAYWTAKVTEQLQKELNAGDKVLVNLASNEYFKVVNTKKLDARIITPVFKDLKNGEYKIISFFARKARGLMCRFVVENNISKPEEMKAFDLEGYYFNSGLSNGDEWVFTRDH
ncbi:MAG TPA: peroxide stress protein YaaA [Prolixibacteraceae bacterium]|nr:peroxide stress protein YaaA [Prolixibacteraceae bacterium]